jgi:hypothetical protein
VYINKLSAIIWKKIDHVILLFVWWCLCHFQQYFSYIVAVNFIGGGNQRTRRKPSTSQLQVTNELYHIMLYTSLWSRFEITTSMVNSTDCIGSCKSNYHTITDVTAVTLQLSDIFFVFFLLWGRWFSPSPLVSSSNKIDCHNITEILLKVA